MGKVLLGPVLRFGGVSNSRWNISALLVLAPQAKIPTARLNVSERVDPITLYRRTDGTSVVAYRFAVAMAPKEISHTLKIFDREICFVVPAVGQAPRMAYASCNGFSDPKLMKKVADKNERWKHLMKRHTGKDWDGKHAPYHLLLMGGDQVYADSLWSEVPQARAWAEKGRKEQISSPYDTAFDAAIERFYFNLYVTRWAQADPAAAFAAIPTVMMWDDHDIFDGWGSHAADLQACSVFRGIYRQAERYFRLFQLHESPDDASSSVLVNQDGYSYATRVGPTAIVVLDMRSERTSEQVMSDKSWNAVQNWLNSQGRDNPPRHLFVMSSIPVVHPDLGLLDRLLAILPGTQDLEDDLLDHWTHRQHRQERLRFIHRLYEFVESARCRVTILSGDVHVGAVGMLRNNRLDMRKNGSVINQLTSSAIVHPGPPGMAMYFLESVSDEVEVVDRDIVAELLPFPATRTRFIGGRNWLALEPDSDEDPQGRYWASWHVEGEKHPYTKAIHLAS